MYKRQFLSYGEFQTDRFLEVNPSDKYEVIDENKNVLYNKILNLHLGENYTIFFANQPNNKYFELLELSNKAVSYTHLTLPTSDLV